jgi:hypothetical protein
MSSDRLPLPDMIAEPAKADGAAVAHADDAARAPVRGVFTEYKAADPAPEVNETDTLLQTLARLEAAVREAPSQVSAGMLRGLAEFAAAIKQIESMLSANEAPSPDVHFAIEHMQDVAMALRSRDVEAALCDALDGAIRQVGDAIVRGEAAAARTHSAAALLGELAGQINQMIAFGDNVIRAAAEELDTAAAERFGDTANPPLADSIDASPSDQEQASSSLPLPLVAPLPDKQADDEPSETQTIPFESAPSPLLSAPLIVEDEAFPASRNESELRTVETSESILAVSVAAIDIMGSN